MPETDRREEQTAGRTKNIRFLESMPKPLIVVFLACAAAGVGLVVWLFAHPPNPPQVALALRRSPPAGSYSHDVVRIRLEPIPSVIPPYRPPSCVAGLVIEGGTPAQDRIDRVLRALCPIAGPGAPAELRRAVQALSTARIRFALFTRTGDLSTTDLSARRILLAVALARTNVPVGVIAPLLVHEGYHLALGLPVTATQEFHARLAELEACDLLFDAAHFTRGCSDAQAMVRLGEARAVDLLVRVGYPR